MPAQCGVVPAVVLCQVGDADRAVVLGEDRAGRLLATGRLARVARAAGADQHRCDHGEVSAFDLAADGAPRLGGGHVALVAGVGMLRDEGREHRLAPELCAGVVDADDERVGVLDDELAHSLAQALHRLAHQRAPHAGGFALLGIEEYGWAG
ncbi:hypothetical protein D9M69_637400 [compost metagenome]